jgi:hypothetical protein
MVEGDSSANWLDAKWEDRPVNNYWWVDNPNNPQYLKLIFLIRCIKDYRQDILVGTHMEYTSIPTNATVIQRKDDTDIITWETTPIW